MKLQKKAEQFAKKYGFTGGPIKSFDKIGRLYLIMLLEEGLYPDSKVLDIGCGALRGGYWLIHFLDPSCYFGIEIDRQRLNAGIESFLEPGLIDFKNPHFDHNNSFDFSVFGEKFNFMIARSIWSHASKQQLELMLDGFLEHSTDDAIFLASYVKAETEDQDYKGNKWINVASHSLHWIEHECNQRNLVVQELKRRVYNQQIWLKITKKIPVISGVDTLSDTQTV